MCNLGMSFGVAASRTAEVPYHSRAAEITLADYHETVFVDISFWSERDYHKHWEQSAIQLIETSMPQLFCSSLGKDVANIWIGVPSADLIKFYNRFCSVKELAIIGTQIRPEAPIEEFIGSPTGEWSSWEVPLEYVGCLARRGVAN